MLEIIRDDDQELSSKNTLETAITGSLNAEGIPSTGS